MKLLGPAVNINQKKIVQQKVFNKIILIKALLICYQKILNLKSRYFSYCIDIFSRSLCSQDIFKLLFIKYLKVLTPPYFLGICRGFGKICRLRSPPGQTVHRSCYFLSIRIHNTEIYSDN